jgi:hypothetical protein
MGVFSSSWLFMLGPLKLRESAHERAEARFMVFAIKQSLVPSPERRFHRKVEEATKRMSLESNAFDNILVIGAWLVFQEVALK